MNRYENIVFGSVFTGTLEQFKEKFKHKKVFRDMLPEKREKELELAYNIAISEFTPPEEDEPIRFNPMIIDSDGQTIITA